MPDPLDEEQVPQSDHEWAQLRRQAKEAQKERDALQAQLAAATRDSAMARAGVDLTDPRAKYFVKAYDGDETPEAIKAEWAQFSNTSGAAPQQPTQKDVADAAAMTRIENAAAGGTASAVPEREAARAKLFADVATATAGISDPFMKEQIAQTMMRNSGLVDFSTND